MKLAYYLQARETEDLIMPDQTTVPRKPDIDIAEAGFRAGFSELLATAPPHILRAHSFFSVPANLPPWFDTGLDLGAGESLTVVAIGRTYFSHERNLCVYPDMQLWYRIGELGSVFRGTRYSHTFLVREGGRLFLGN
jgi:hypothetical protein